MLKLNLTVLSCEKSVLHCVCPQGEPGHRGPDGPPGKPGLDVSQLYKQPLIRCYFIYIYFLLIIIVVTGSVSD